MHAYDAVITICKHTYSVGKTTQVLIITPKRPNHDYNVVVVLWFAEGMKDIMFYVII